MSRDVIARDQNLRHAIVQTSLICLCTFFSLSVWFSAAFIPRDLNSGSEVGAWGVAFFVVGVQLGFVVGALGSAALGLQERFSNTLIFSISSLLCALLTLWSTFVIGAAEILILRFLIGMFLAGIYPPAVRLIASWAPVRWRGRAIAALIASLTLGSAFPHLLGGMDWRLATALTAALAAASAVIMWFRGQTGPLFVPLSRVRLRDTWRALRNKWVVLAIVAYSAHMWELYAMWAWVGAFLAVRAGNTTVQDGINIPLLSFAAIAVGGFGALLAGLISDRWGRARSAILSVILSGIACTFLVFSAEWAFPVVICLVLLWGFWVIAESAQYSAIVSEECEPEHVGSILAFQMGTGYAVTALSISVTPLFIEYFSWELALAMLLLGPVIGIASLIPLLSRDKSSKR